MTTVDLLILIVSNVAIFMVLIKLLRWLLNYTKLVYEINKIPSAIHDSKMIPFIGNSHSIKNGPSNLKSSIQHEIKVYKHILSFRLPTQKNFL